MAIPTTVYSVAFSPDGRLVLTGSRNLYGSENTPPQLWDASTGNLLRTFSGVIGSVESAAISPNGQSVLIASTDQTPETFHYYHTMQLWDISTGDLLHTFSGHTDAVTSVAFSPDGRVVLTGSEDETARLWDAITGDLCASSAAIHMLCGSVAFSPDGRYVLTGSDDQTARLWDANTGDLLRTFSGHTGV